MSVIHTLYGSDIIINSFWTGGKIRMKTRKNVERALLEVAQKIKERDVIKNASRWLPYYGGFAHS